MMHRFQNLLSNSTCTATPGRRAVETGSARKMRRDEEEYTEVYNSAEKRGGGSGGGGEGNGAGRVAGGVRDGGGAGGRDLHSFSFQLKLSSSVHRATQLTS